MVTVAIFAQSRAILAQSQRMSGVASVPRFCCKYTRRLTPSRLR